MDAQARLEAAIARDDLPGLEAALAEGASVDLPDAAGRPPLAQAVVRPGVAGRRAARALLAAGADVHWRDPRHGWSVLMHAVDGPGDAGLVELLLEAGADPDGVSPWGETPLHRALRDGRLDKALPLAQASRKPDRRNATGASARDLARDLVQRAQAIAAALDAAAPPAAPREADSVADEPPAL